MKILYLSYDGMTDALGQSQVLPYLVGLSKLGHQITIVSAEKKENYLKRKPIIDQIVNNAFIVWNPIFYTKKPPVFSTIFDIFKLKSTSKKLHKTENFDVVHCRSYITSLVGLHLKRKFGIKFIFDMRGFWADERVDGNLWNLKNPLFKLVYRYFKKKEIDFLCEADYTICLTESAKSEMLENWNLKKNSPIKVIPCCADVAHFDYHKFEQKPTNDISKSLHIVYLGSLGTWYMLEEMLILFNEISKKYPHATLQIISPDDSKQVFEKASVLQINTKSIAVNSAERSEVPLYLSKANISLFFIKPAYSKKSSSPTKMGEILAMGIPIIANKNMGDNEFLFKKYNCGVLVDDFSITSFQKVIDQLPVLNQIPKESLRNAALDYFELKKGIEKYQEVYLNLAQKN